MRQWISELNGLLWTINGTSTAMPAFFWILNNDFFFIVFVYLYVDNI